MEPKICIQLSPPLKPQQSNDNDKEQKRDTSCKETVNLKFAKFAPEAWTDLVGIYIHTYIAAKYTMWNSVCDFLCD